MKKIISIILGVLLMFSMSVTSFAAKTDVITPNPETIVFEIACIDAFSAKDIEGNADKYDMIYTFETTVSNKTKSNINLSDYAVALVFINDKTYENIDAVNVDLANKWINADYKEAWATKNEADDALVTAPDTSTVNKVLMDYDDVTTVDIKAYVNGQAADDDTAMIKSVGDKIVITLDVTPKAATPDVPTTETTTEAPTEAPTQAPTEAPTNAPTEAPEVTNPVEDTEDDYITPVDPEIPDTGAATPIGAIGTLIGSAVAAVIAKKRKKIDE